ncbi:MAG: hypothetical protein CM1200mP41_12780 [Gammaproteobacteria bacterium]|nr:MAG: hypothetical protein CM1200mP41_12780 [Gammaproteobacteria bacterium]
MISSIAGPSSAREDEFLDTLVHLLRVDIDDHRPYALGEDPQCPIPKRKETVQGRTTAPTDKQLGTITPHDVPWGGHRVEQITPAWRLSRKAAHLSA